jgi:hypothetical protein
MKTALLRFFAFLVAGLATLAAGPALGQQSQQVQQGPLHSPQNQREVVLKNRQIRQIHTIEGPGDFPRYLKPGTIIAFPFQQLNWFKYAPTITSQGRVQEYAQTTLPGLEPAPASTLPLAGEKSFDKKLLAVDSFEDKSLILNQEVAAYQELADKLEDLYTSDYWLAFDANREQCAWLVNRLFGTDNISAWQFVTAPQYYKEQAASLLAGIEKKKPANSQLIASVKMLQARLEAELSADRRKRLATLGRMLVVLQAPLPKRPPSQVVLPDDKDAAELTVDYRLRADYQPPASGPATALPKDEFTILLLPRFRITASVGIYASGLVDHSFVFINDSLVTGRSQAAAPDTTTRRVYGARKRIERSNDGEWYSLVGAAAFGHFEYRLHPNWGLGMTLGVGVQNSGPRFLLGPTVLIGNDQRLILSGGLATGRVVRLATGYSEGHAAAIKDPGTSQVPTRTVTATSWFLALSYNLKSSLK